jgi:hypothetical protein
MSASVEGIHIHVLLRLAELKPDVGTKPDPLAIGMITAFDEVRAHIESLLSQRTTK